MTEHEDISIPKISLFWSDWYKWNDIKLDQRQKQTKKISIPNKKSGVYEAKYENEEKRLTIGKASDLRNRVRQGLVKGIIPHSTGKRMRDGKVSFTRVVVRWAETNRPSAVEEELHRKYVKKYGNMPKYVKTT